MIQWAIRSQASFEREWKVQRLIAKPKSGMDMVMVDTSAEGSVRS